MKLTSYIQYFKKTEWNCFIIPYYFWFSKISLQSITLNKNTGQRCLPCKTMPIGHPVEYLMDKTVQQLMCFLFILPPTLPDLKETPILTINTSINKPINMPLNTKPVYLM